MLSITTAKGLVGLPAVVLRVSAHEFWTAETVRRHTTKLNPRFVARQPAAKTSPQRQPSARWESLLSPVGDHWRWSRDEPKPGKRPTLCFGSASAGLASHGEHDWLFLRTAIGHSKARAHVRLALHRPASNTLGSNALIGYRGLGNDGGTRTGRHRDRLTTHVSRGRGKHSRCFQPTVISHSDVGGYVRLARHRYRAETAAGTVAVTNEETAENDPATGSLNVTVIGMAVPAS